MGRHRVRDGIKWYRSADTLSCNWSQHWCPICVHYQFSCALKLARKYEIEHWSRSSKTINWSADSFQINHVTSMSWHMSPRYGHGILVSGYPVLTAVNWPYCECPILKSYIKDVDLPKHAWDTPPFLLIVSPTPPVQSVDAYARMYLRTFGQSRDNQTKRGWPYSMSMGLEGRVGALLMRFYFTNQLP